MIEAAPQAQILRLSRLSGQFVAHLVDQEAVKSSLGATTVRAETILDAIFFPRCCCGRVRRESGEVYEAAWSVRIAQAKFTGATRT